MRAVFLDRDGVVVKGGSFITQENQVELEDHAIEAVRILNNLNMPVVIVTNQPQIARGLCSENDIKRINSYIVRLLQEEGAKIDAVYYCPHHPEKQWGGNMQYRIECGCRKPKPGMLRQAQKDIGVELKNSFIVGDSKKDIDAGKSEGLITIQVGNKEETDADYHCKSLY